MRPIRLEFEGFGAFRTACAIDFDDCDFFALVGPTGSGKSTVLDAVCFALYGSVPRYDDRRVIGPCVNVQAVEAKVALTFDVGPHRYVAVRVMRRDKKGKVATKEIRLERFDEHGNTDVLAAKDAEFDAAILELLGLTFEQFTTCVLLPQGAFARFLHESPSERQDLLVKLLGLSLYEQMARLARDRASALDALREVLKSRLDDLAGATPGALEAGRARVRELDELLAVVDNQRPSIDALERRRLEAETELRELAPFIERLAAVMTPASVVEGAARLSESRARFATATDAVAAASAARRAAAAALAAAPSESDLVLANDAHEKIAVTSRERERSDEELGKASAREKVAASLLTRAIDKEAAAQHAVASAERAEMASALAETLVPGEPCPVCGQTVHKPPRPLDAPARAGAERVLKAAKAALAKAQAEAQGSALQRAAAAQRRQGLVEEIARLGGAVAAHPDRAVARAALDGVRALTAAAAKSQRSELDAHEQAAAAQRRLDQISEELRFGSTLLQERRDPLGVLDPPPVDPHDLLASWDTFEVWAAEQRLTLIARQGTCRAHASSAMAEHEAAIAAIAAAVAEHGITAPVSAGVPALKDAIVRASADAAARLQWIAGQVKDRADLEQRHRDASEAHKVATLLAQLLSARRFERWLLNEALGALVNDASVTMRRLTIGQFSLALTENGDIDVIDHVNADERRPARSLSGGETFQASLALALALSERLTQLASGGAARLDAIFLDEGFGSLDVDTLEAVASTIEALASDGNRMVGIVTHIKELAERVAVRFVVTKGAGTATIERVSA